MLRERWLAHQASSLTVSRRHPLRPSTAIASPVSTTAAPSSCVAERRSPKAHAVAVMPATGTHSANVVTPSTPGKRQQSSTRGRSQTLARHRPHAEIGPQRPTRRPQRRGQRTRWLHDESEITTSGGTAPDSSSHKVHRADSTRYARCAPRALPLCSLRPRRTPQAARAGMPPDTAFATWSHR